MFTRRLDLPQHPKRSLFLWGSRQTGKTTLLKQSYPTAMRIDLLRNDNMLRYLRDPSVLREEIASIDKSKIVVIDEIQKVPELLDEVHFLIQEYDRKFVLCGSSARKLKKNHANMLGGRAMRFELFGLSACEIGKKFNLLIALNSGYLPCHYGHEDAAQAIRGYIENYLKEEILQEGITRNLPVFSDFLRVAAIGDTETINLSNIARECGVSVPTVRSHYDILVDTMIGTFVPAFTLRPKRRVIHAPKFYFSDVGVVNHLSRRGAVMKGAELFGKAFENWVFHELSVHRSYSQKYYPISYWKISTGTEVDFILGDGEVAIEVKGKEKVVSHDYKGLLEFKMDNPQVKYLFIISLDPNPRTTEHGIEILPYRLFLEKLWRGEII